jgi:lipid-binding SYLF domain-containing protein
MNPLKTLVAPADVGEMPVDRRAITMSKNHPFRAAALIVLPILVLASCQAMPDRDERGEIVDNSRTELKHMIEKDPQLETMLKESAGYAMFPEVGKGGLLFGGAFGRGAVYERGGKFIGYATVSQASVGGVVGGQMYAQLIVFQDNERLESFKKGDRLRFGAQASAIAITDGAANASEYDNGVAVFIMPRGGLMADASLSGQEFKFVRADEADVTRDTNRDPAYDSADSAMLDD